MKIKIMTLAMGLAMLGITSCSKTDVYDENQQKANKAAEEQVKQEKAVDEYEKNFVDTYGEIDPNQSWDFSTGDEYFSLPSGTRAATRDAATYTMTKSESYYEIEDATLSKMNEVFKEKTNNYNTGKKFAMTVPENDFTIMPIFMGESGGNFKLCMHVDGIGEIDVWEKWEGIQVMGKNSKGVDVTTWTDLKSFDSKKNCLNATAIQSKYITFNGLPAGATMYFYLKITSAASGYNTAGQSLGSINDYMREYQFGANDVTPSKLPGVNKPEIKIIGCEDAVTNSDKDYNDVVFMLYGEPYVPESFEVEDLEKTVKKRYFIEDLGASDDTDFNDIVVDVVSTYTYKKTTSETTGIVTFSEEKVKSRKAEIRALGGTLDFELNIGGTTWKKSADFDPSVMYNTQEPDYTKVLHTIDLPNEYDPASNNISVTVYQKDSNMPSATVNFPADGTVPMIIAANAYEEWSVERVAFNWKKFMNE
ncbi:MAG: hypothetical protein E7103_08215 [Prevotella sp.]|jgi:hypothetical protein|nr:hypothetical protein [Prevotella sp.]